MTDRDRLDRALTELHDAIAHSRAELAAARARADQAPGETARLQSDAHAGRLGPELRELAALVAAGRTTWAEVFAGDSPYGALIGPHLARMAEEYAGSARAALAADQDS